MNSVAMYGRDDAELLALMARWRELEQAQTQAEAGAEQDRIGHEQDGIEHRILTLHAATRAGLVVKARLVERYVVPRLQESSQTFALGILTSLLMDLTA